jgi:AMP nucleosidase
MTRSPTANSRPPPGEPSPLAPFTAQRIDYSLHRLSHYTANTPQHFQNFVLFTNYQFYIDEFCLGTQGDGWRRRRLCRVRRARQRRHPSRLQTAPSEGRRADALASNAGLPPEEAGAWRDHHGQHRRRAFQCQDDHRPHRRAASACLADARPLRGTAQHQALGDYVLAHAYVREDHVLDDDLPVWVPIPPLAEIQVALQAAVAEDHRPLRL